MKKIEKITTVSIEASKDKDYMKAVESYNQAVDVVNRGVEDTERDPVFNGEEMSYDDLHKRATSFKIRLIDQKIHHP